MEPHTFEWEKESTLVIPNDEFRRTEFGWPQIRVFLCFDMTEQADKRQTAGVVWCGVVWCSVVWCGVVWYGVVWYGVVWCGVVWCGVVWSGVVWCGVVWCGVSHLGRGSADW